VAGGTNSGHDLSIALIALMKGVVERQSDGAPWQALLAHESRVRDHVAVLGLELRLDETEGFAYLAQKATAPDEPDLPRLVPRRALTYHVSLLLALLRKRLAEHDATSSERRLILCRDDIVESVRVFMAGSQNEARLEDRIDTAINRAVEMGFLRRLKDQPQSLEVRRILKVFADAQWLDGLAERLGEYRRHAAEGADDKGVGDEA
jgi:hypothetical protein